MATLITLLTDFGTADSYVGEVKGVLLSQVHGVVLADITHQVAPGDVRAAQYILSRVWQRFPQGTVHLAVVDPGVGTSRRALAAQTAGHFFVAPDNGLLSFLPADAHFVSLPVPPTASPTFHARDLFAPAAGQLALGASLSHLGQPITDPYRSPLPVPRYPLHAPHRAHDAGKHSVRSNTNNVSGPNARRSTGTQCGALSMRASGTPGNAGMAPSPSHTGDWIQ